jgi:hypothetical protein
VATPTPVHPPYSARTPPSGYNAGWILQEHKRLEQAFQPHGTRLVDHTTPSQLLTILPTDAFVFVDALIGEDIHLALPNPATVDGRMVTVKKLDFSGNNVVLDDYLIDGIPDWTLALPYQSVTIIAALSQWHLLCQT